MNETIVKNGNDFAVVTKSGAARPGTKETIVTPQPTKTASPKASVAKLTPEMANEHPHLIGDDHAINFFPKGEYMGFRRPNNDG